ncbi:MAG: prephenate dehydrogenase/arogenate dehydrogenase family protein [Halothiobacillaceae bacterium]|nr:prephenate dehydrogenase/arogenate dehydrogenase family protein [Halothiobacillaceae bacterium]MDY0049227.1 prephenate dehydrogenase/arogenate dehydrogenase family protein [Halothiobacillaceae bacterium]
MIERLALIGTGLIGGSLALALKAAGAVGEVVGCGRNPATLERARELGIIDRYATDPAQAVAGADVVFLAVPIAAMREVFRALRPGLAGEVLITDGGSAKGCVVEDARAELGPWFAHFVPGHPIAGTEQSGPDAAFATLFAGRRVILTPLPENSAEDVARAEALWLATGAQLETMSVAHHDHVLAATSHLPHVLAFTLVDSLARMEERQEIFRYAAGGFRDFTRIASSDPTMWRDICLGNRTELLALIGRFQQDLSALAASIEAGEGEALSALFARAKRVRDTLYSL